MLPKTDGYQLARDLKTLPGMVDVLLVCISGYGTESDKRVAYAVGCAYHFIKPADWQELADLLATVKADVTRDNMTSAGITPIKEELDKQSHRVQDSVRCLLEKKSELQATSGEDVAAPRSKYKLGRSPCAGRRGYE